MDTARAMSQENADIVRQVYEAYNARDMDALSDLYDPDVVMHHVEGWPEPETAGGTGELGAMPV
jgi:hypothetical protein